MNFTVCVLIAALFSVAMEYDGLTLPSLLEYHNCGQ